MSEFTDYLQDTFCQFGSIQIKRMFGGYGVYHQGLMFALVDDEVLYFKADDVTKPEFEERGLGPFEYQKANKTVALSYFQAPEEIYEDSELAAHWAQQAYDIALKAKK